MNKEKINELIDRYAMTKGPLNRVDLQIFAYAVFNEADKLPLCQTSDDIADAKEDR